MSMSTQVAAGFARLALACNALAGRSLPPGGTVGHVLTKTGAASYVSAWAAPASGSGNAVAGTKTLSYTNGVLTSVNGPGAATKSLTYTNGVLSQVQSVAGGVVKTVVLGYTAAGLSTVGTVLS